MTDWYERAEQELEDDLSSGRISLTEYNAAMRELSREYQDAAHEAAEQAYDREMENW